MKIVVNKTYEQIQVMGSLFTIASAMVKYVSTLPWIPACFLKMNVRKEIYSSEPEPKFPTGANSDILGVTISNSPQRCTSGSAFNPRVLEKRPQVKETRD